MAHAKAQIVGEVLRAHYGHCFHYLPKAATMGSSNYLPPPAAARNTPFERVTCVVSDVSILMNMFRMGDHEPTGRELVDFLLQEVKRAFEHKRVHTYVMVADMSCFSVEAKEVLQKQRLEYAQTRASRDGIPLVAWDVDEPTQLVHFDRKLPSLTAMQASPGVLRQVLYEAMSLIPLRYDPPPGKRLILHMEPRIYTAPASPAEFMPTDSAATGIVICDDRKELVDASRDELTALWRTIPVKEWRRRARERTTELAKCGAFQTVPLCVETSTLGVCYEPFRLLKMKTQAGEGDLACQRYIPYLYTAAIVDRLMGERQPRTLETNAQFYTAEQLASSRRRTAPAGKFEFYVGDEGRKEVQCTAVVSVDSDFCGLALFVLAQLVAGVDNEAARDRFPMMVAHAPLLVRGTVLTKTRDTLARGQRRGYYPDGAERAQHLCSSYELFDPAALYAELVRTGPVGTSPLRLVVADAVRRGDATRAKAAANREAKKRLLVTLPADQPPGQPPAKKSRGRAPAAAAPDEEAADDDEEDGESPVIHMPPLPDGAGVECAYERVTSFVMFMCLCGNDYLGGLPGVSRRWAYAAYAEMLHAHPDAHLVRVYRAPGDTATPTAMLPAYIDVGVHEQLLKYAYYTNLAAQACKTNKPTLAVHEMTLSSVAKLVADKFKSVAKHVPDDERRERMWMRLHWVYKYFASGMTNIRNIADPLEWGWEGRWRHVIV